MSHLTPATSARMYVAAVLVVGLALGLVGCSTGSSRAERGPLVVTSAGHKPSGSVYKGSVPHFSGPWAAEFAQEYRSTTSSLDHTILATGQITDQDYAAVSSVFVSCMAAQGYVATVGPAIDNYTVQNHGTTKADIDAQVKATGVCDPPFSAVSQLRLDLLANPQHQDENVLVTACLVKNKLVSPGYTVAQYKAELETQQFPFDLNAPAVMACLGNPLGKNLSQTSP